MCRVSDTNLHILFEGLYLQVLADTGGAARAADEHAEQHKAPQHRPDGRKERDHAVDQRAAQHTGGPL